MVIISISSTDGMVGILIEVYTESPLISISFSLFVYCSVDSHHICIVEAPMAVCVSPKSKG